MPHGEASCQKHPPFFSTQLEVHVIAVLTRFIHLSVYAVEVCEEFNGCGSALGEVIKYFAVSIQIKGRQIFVWL